MSFALTDWSTVQTLSTNIGSGATEIRGLLYVPVLQSSDACTNLTARYIPSNVTRRADFPNYQDQVSLVAVAPWVSADCTQSYLAAARQDAVKAAIFFLPGNSTAQPPQPGDSSWSLNDGGQWKETNKYPVYAISGIMGQIMMNELSLYSGNMTDVPFGDDLVDIYESRDYARLFTDISLGSNGPGLPSLWVFLIIVLGILLTVVAITSLIMHMLQRRHRRELRRRIANGEVNLEALGIKRLNVPPDILEKMPRYVFTSKEEGAATSASSGDMRSVTTAGAVPEVSAEQSSSRDTAARAALPHREVPFSQPTCSICLDDFEHNLTIVRELPCSHIFHPECIDGFLKDNSSLCPMCKKSALPQGYLVADVTNAMVRRERLIRRMRERVTVVHLEDGSNHQSQRGGPLSMQSRYANFYRQFTRPSRRRRASDAAFRAGIASGSAELADVPRHVAPTLTEDAQPPLEVQRAGTSARREWGRNRLRSAALHARTPADEARAMEQALPKCRSQVGLACELCSR